MRSIINPTFSSLNLRDLSPKLIMCTDRLLNVLGKNVQTELDVSK